MHKLTDNADDLILKTLLSATPLFVSGSVIASELGVSRAAVCERLKHFRQQGFSIEAKTHRGYRIVEEPGRPHLALIKAYLSKQYQTQIPLSCFDCIDSTNDEAERQRAQGQQAPFVVIACKQTKGRGRMGRQWHGSEEGNAYLSFGFQPRLSPQRMQRFTLWIGIKVCDFLNKYTGLPLMIKWPNDLMLEGKKVGGILTEAHVDTEQIRDLVLGLGVNVNSNCRNWPKELYDKATSLSEALNRPLALNPLLAEITQTCLKAYHTFTESCVRDQLFTHWRDYDSLWKKPIRVQPGKVSLTGIAEGIDENGALLLRRDDKELVALNAGEVSIRTTL